MDTTTFQITDILTGALAAGFVVLILWLAAPWGRRVWVWVRRPGIGGSVTVELSSRFKRGGENGPGTVQKGMASRFGLMTTEECRIAFGGYQPTGPCPDNPEPPTGDTAIMPRPSAVEPAETLY